MLSLRNGLNMLPVGFAEDLQPLYLSQMRVEYGEDEEEDGSCPLNLTATNKRTVPSPSNIINSDIPFGLDFQVIGHLKPFEHTRSSSEVCSSFLNFFLCRHQFYSCFLELYCRYAGRICCNTSN